MMSLIGSRKEPCSVSALAALLLSGLLILACAASQPVDRTDLPPRELLKDDLARASYVCEVEVAAVEQTAAFQDDSGAIGYVQYTATARPTRVIKGDIGLQSTLSYRFTVEYDPSSGPPVTPGKRYVLFLKRAADGQLWLFSEGAQFPSSPTLLRQLGVD
jgi:hypothetical protein